MAINDDGHRAVREAGRTARKFAACARAATVSGVAVVGDVEFRDRLAEQGVADRAADEASLLAVAVEQVQACLGVRGFVAGPAQARAPRSRSRSLHAAGHDDAVFDVSRHVSPEMPVGKNSEGEHSNHSDDQPQ